MAVEVKIPSLGESVSQGIISKWLKQNGDTVETDEILFELETDKAAMEIPADAAGTLEILKPEGSEVEVGTVVARIATDGKAPAKRKEAAPAAGPETEREEPKPARREAAKEESAPRPAAAKPREEEGREEEAREEDEREKEGDKGEKKEGETKKREKKAGEKKEEEEKEEEEETAEGRGEALLSPAVRKLVTEHDLDPSKIPASGKGGRLTKGDVLEFLDRKPSSEPAPEPKAPEPEEPAKREEPSRRVEAKKPDLRISEGEETERVRMSLLRRRIAERMVQAQQTAAILTTFNEIDMSAVMELRKRYRERFQKTHGVGLGFMSLFGRAVIQALREIPVVNAQVDGTDIVYFRRVHLGIAVGTPRGLVVPVVRDADLLSIAALEKAIGELATLARDGKLLPDQLAGGTFTITNGGIFGSLLSTPILNPPQSGILGMHKIEERPVVVNGEIVVRPMMYVALSYDHRLVDGEQAVTFLVRVKERLEDPARLLLEV